MAQPEQTAPSFEALPATHPPRVAEVVTLRPKAERGGGIISEAAGPRLGPARGLLLGLLLGALLWAAIGAVVWKILH